MAKHYQNVHGVKSLHSCDHCDWKTPDRNTWLFHLLKAHDQRQLLVAPPRPGMDLSELEIFHSNRDKQLQGDALVVTNMTLRSIDSSNLIEEVQSPGLLDIGLRHQPSYIHHTLTVREKNDMICKEIAPLKGRSKLNTQERSLPFTGWTNQRPTRPALVQLCPGGRLKHRFSHLLTKAVFTACF